MTSRIVMTLGVVSMLLTPLRVSGTTLAVVTPAQVSGEVIVTELHMRDGAVSGNVVNESTKNIREVKLLIRQAWLWNDERHPGTDDPGRTLTFVLGPDISPRGVTSFTLQTPPDTPRSDGRFVTTVEVASFTEVGW